PPFPLLYKHTAPCGQPAGGLIAIAPMAATGWAVAVPISSGASAARMPTTLRRRDRFIASSSCSRSRHTPGWSVSHVAWLSRPVTATELPHTSYKRPFWPRCPRRPGDLLQPPSVQDIDRVLRAEAPGFARAARAIVTGDLETLRSELAADP